MKAISTSGCVTVGLPIVAPGSDLDGAFGREQAPHDLETIADLARVPAMLAKRGYSAADIEKVMHGNWLRLLRTAWA